MTYLRELRIEYPILNIDLVGDFRVLKNYCTVQLSYLSYFKIKSIYGTAKPVNGPSPA